MTKFNFNTAHDDIHVDEATKLVYDSSILKVEMEINDSYIHVRRHTMSTGKHISYATRNTICPN